MLTTKLKFEIKHEGLPGIRFVLNLSRSWCSRLSRMNQTCNERRSLQRSKCFSFGSDRKAHPL